MHSNEKIIVTPITTPMIIINGSFGVGSGSYGSVVIVGLVGYLVVVCK